MSRTGRPPKISDDDLTVLADIVRRSPMATTEELCVAFEGRTGIRVHGQTLIKGLRGAGIERRMGNAGAMVQKSSPNKARYGYKDSHRRLAPEQRYPSCLTDVEWNLVADLFENDGGRGTPEHYARRQLVDACCYVVRTGGSWR